jgi:hypothetical protein
MSYTQNTPPVLHASTDNAGWAYLLMKILTELLPPLMGSAGMRRHMIGLTAPEDWEKGPLELFLACESAPIAITLSDEDLVKNPQELAVEIRDLVKGAPPKPKSPEAIAWEKGYETRMLEETSDSADIPVNPYL